VILIFDEQASTYQKIFGVILLVIGGFAIAKAMMGLGFKAQAQVGFKLPRQPLLTI
jgi:hypothetical protein